MTFAAGYPKSVPAPIAPRGQGYGRYGTGYQNVFYCRSANNVFHVREFSRSCGTQSKGKPIPFFIFLFAPFFPPLFFLFYLTARSRSIERMSVMNISKFDSLSIRREQRVGISEETRGDRCDFAMLFLLFIDATGHNYLTRSTNATH